jgi:serine protease Do
MDTLLRVVFAAFVMLLGARAPAASGDVAPHPLGDMLAASQARMVKVYGAGGVRGLEGYQTGFLISAQGHILTVWSHVLDADEVTIHLADGRRMAAKTLGADPRVEVAVLKIEASGLPYFDLKRAPKADLGTRVFALSNMFGVATGNEPTSVQRGTIAAATRLEARRGTFDTPYHGAVYVLDVVTGNPGAAGGALIDRDGQLVGILGKELRNALNNTWLNYAIPIDAIRDSVEQIEAGKFVARASDEGRKKPPRSLTLAMLGVVLIPNVVERTPPYVDRVLPDSPAEKAGIAPDDLVVLVGSRLTQSVKMVQNELQWIDAEDEVRLTILRGQDMKEFTLNAKGTAKR